MITAGNVEARLFDFASQQQREDQFSSCVTDPLSFRDNPLMNFPQTLQWLETYRWMCAQLLRPDHDSAELIDRHLMRRVYKGLVFNWLKSQLPANQILLTPRRTDALIGRIFPRPRIGLDFPDGIGIESDVPLGSHINTFYEYSSISFKRPSYYREKYKNFLAIKDRLPVEITGDANLMFIVMKREDPEKPLPITEEGVSFSEMPFAPKQFQEYLDYLFRDFRFDYGEEEQGPSLQEIAQEAQVQATRIKTIKKRREIWKDKLPL